MMNEQPAEEELKTLTQRPRAQVENRPSPCALFRSAWEERDGRMEPVQSPDLFVWACVHARTGEVETTEIQPYDDELNQNLVDGWEWRRFRLVEAPPEAPTAQ